MEQLRPLDTLNEARGKNVIVELKNNKQLVGKLKAFDIHVNTVLEDGEEKEIAQEALVQEEDIVITSGLEEKIPRGLYVGRVNQVESLVGQVFKRARVSPSIK